MNKSKWIQPNTQLRIELRKFNAKMIKLKRCLENPAELSKAQDLVFLKGLDALWDAVKKEGSYDE